MSFIRENCNLGTSYYSGVSKPMACEGMGTKIEYSTNLLATSVDRNNFTLSGVDVWDHCQSKGLTNNGYSIGINKLQDPMDRMLDRSNIESIKKTMQMHEDIFKHQVRELHRVYNVQKMLMDDLKNEIKQKKFWTPMNGIGIMSHPHFIEQQQQTTQISYEPDFQVQSLRADLCSKERSGSCSGDTIKMQRGFDLERPAEEDIFAGACGCDEGEAGPNSHTAFQTRKITTDGSDEEMGVDLTLSIGGSRVKNKKKSHLHPLGCSGSPNGKTRELNSSASFQSDRIEECSDPTTPMSSSSVTFDQERKGLHWLSQGLKLK